MKTRLARCQRISLASGIKLPHKPGMATIVQNRDIPWEVRVATVFDAGGIIRPIWFEARPVPEPYCPGLAFLQDAVRVCKCFGCQILTLALLAA